MNLSASTIMGIIELNNPFILHKLSTVTNKDGSGSVVEALDVQCGLNTSMYKLVFKINSKYTKSIFPQLLLQLLSSH